MYFHVLVVEDIDKVRQPTFLIHRHVGTSWNPGDMPARVSSCQFQIVSGIASSSTDLIEGDPNSLCIQMHGTDLVVADLDHRIVYWLHTRGLEEVQAAQAIAFQHLLGISIKLPVIHLMIKREDDEIIIDSIDRWLNQMMERVIVQQFLRTIVGRGDQLDPVFGTMPHELGHEHGIAWFGAMELVEDQ